MPDKKYAIRCSTQEQARECIEKGLNYTLHFLTGNNPDWIKSHSQEDLLVLGGYTIITYSEAKDLGLLNSPEKADSGESKIEELDLDKLILQDSYQEWVGNKSFNENIVDKINEIIRHLNK